MNTFKTFQEFLASQSIQIPFGQFLMNLILAGLMGYLLRLVYIKYGESISNRKRLANNFSLLAVTTMIIISIVKSSLALSLGLVGALSIVRFRTAIKEPEELSYLFLVICIGLGLGANQATVTILGFCFVIILILLRKQASKNEESKNLLLSISNRNPQKISLKEITEIVNNTATSVNIKRFDETADILEATFIVEFNDFDALDKCKNNIQDLGKEAIAVTFMDNKGLI